MPVIEDRILIRGSIAAIFDLSQDYTRRLDWDPYLSKAEMLGKETVIRPGTRVYCRSRKGIGMTVEYVTFNRPHFTAVKLCNDFFILDNFAGSWRFQAKDDAWTEVIFRYNFLPKPLFRPLAPLLNRILRRDLDKRLRGLKAYVERTLPA